MYKKEQFNGCAFNPLIEEPMVDVYTKLLEVFTTTNDSIIRYTIMLYDPKSPLLNETEPDIRKRTASNLCQLLLIKEIESTLQESCIEYLQFINSKQWAVICATDYWLWESIGLIMQPITGVSDKEQLEAAQKKNVLSDSIDDAMKKLDNYYRLMSGGDKELESKMVSMKKTKRFTPERIGNV